MSTLRTWERRYGIPSPRRTSGRQRVYSEDDVQRILAIGQLLERGWTVAGAASSVANSVLPAAGADSSRPVRPPLSAGALAQLLHEVADAVVVVDLDGSITFWNAAAEQLFGWRAEDVIGRPIVAVVVPPERRDIAAKAVQLLIEGDFTPDQGELARRDGTRFRATIATSPLYDDANDQLVGIIGIASDVTEKEASRTLAQVRAAELESIAVLGLNMGRAPDPADVIDDAVQAIRRIFAITDVWVFGIEGDSYRLWSTPQRSIGSMFDDSSSLLHYTRRVGRPVISNDVRSERRFDPTPLIVDHRAASALAVPMQGPDGAVGVLVCASATPRTFTTEDAHYLQAIGNILSTLYPPAGQQGQ